ncbi:MAG: hypothetical protein ACKVYV_10640 [Limisphaerales bacterium]
MSLKSLHIIFVGSSVLLCAFMTVWFGLEHFLRGHGAWNLVMAAAAAAGGVALFIYGRRFLEKLKHISYL